MKHVFIKNGILLLLGIGILYLMYITATSHRTYTVHYNTYRYYWEDDKYIPGCKNCQMTVTGYSEEHAIRNVKELLYLNNMLAGDSLEILTVDQL